MLRLSLHLQQSCPGLVLSWPLFSALRSGVGAGVVGDWERFQVYEILQYEIIIVKWSKVTGWRAGLASLECALIAVLVQAMILLLTALFIAILSAPVLRKDF
jgi:hypothetical protein